MGFRASKRHREQTLLYWEKVSEDRDSEPILADPIEIKVKWIPKKIEVLDPQGNTITLDATAITDRELVIGSVVMLGDLDSLNQEGPLTGLHVVTTYDEVPDGKNRRIARTVGCTKYKDSTKLAKGPLYFEDGTTRIAFEDGETVMVGG